ncbi:tumor necrosis factor receptor superfamily member 14-like [Mauremys reevesii]|uniref:tumor necrosis factor receptor superfamily member 14-like n=1 Tax=Mauremys reevesii TaxID=260615 RepID=UPI00193F69AA|nr:tumor necrosis factor receptor superfamily member 14-like [Mauremys reevesii]
MPQTHGEECYTCPEGKYCVPPQKPQFCPKGFFCPKGTGLDWQPCPPGTYSPEQGLKSSTGCRACDGGKYCLYHNATDVTGECWEGYYCAQASDRPNPEARLQGQAGPCPPGHYCPKGTAVPKHCPVGTFSTRIKLSSEDMGISAMELDSYLLLVSVKLGSIAPEELFLLDLPKTLLPKEYGVCHTVSLSTRNLQLVLCICRAGCAIWSL